VSSNTTLTLAHYTCCCLTLAQGCVPTNRTHTVPCTHARALTCDQARKSTPPKQTSTLFAHLVQGLVDRSTGAAQRLLIPTPQPGARTTPQRVPWSAYNTHTPIPPQLQTNRSSPKTGRCIGRSGLWAHLIGLVLSEAHGDKAFECGGGLLRGHGGMTECTHSAPFGCWGWEQHEQPMLEQLS
jgi:hypothetical protein